ncbi:gliding motility-associated peptidyl-prolyl isomerase GldI [Robiginitalea marina]|uniref:Peptidyl-prolyl cis-trans isomerase n=1 Tax=Robiginitalea marina TaxID=2954105 RepID=A0ABT1B0H2_9FLAO|nr:gliding motility-associated peptidyl-prolyl isomerase GldI [Robiginitalea marina]MCO5725459.1 gliding motility-associated peptidyl-prolyl isomerase GldI [Robiginitalea marina]
MKKFFILACLSLLAASCTQQQPRRPVEVKSGSFLKQSAARNKQLLAREETLMQELIARDSLHRYLDSSSGFRFYYNSRQAEGVYLPGTDDWVTLTYDLRTWNEDTLYTREETGVIRYKVDKMELFPGLRASVKMLGEGETATFLYPSSLAFGYHGDNDRIGPNVPLKCTLTVLEIEKQTDENHDEN